MIYDANTWVGHWPFRALPRKTVPALLKEMDGHGIDKALVGSLHGLLYKDAHEANHELAKEIGKHRDRLVPCATLNPTYYGWQHDLTQCREEFGMPVLRMFPDYHGYGFDEPAAREMIEQAQALKMTISFYGRVVDPRGRHRVDPGRETDMGALKKLLGEFPKGRFLLLNFPRKLGDDAIDKTAYYDICRFVGTNGLRLGRELKKLGTSRFVMGTTMLMRYAKPTLLGLEKCTLTSAQREAIHWKNLAKIVPDVK